MAGLGWRKETTVLPCYVISAKHWYFYRNRLLWFFLISGFLQTRTISSNARTAISVHFRYLRVWVLGDEFTIQNIVGNDVFPAAIFGQSLGRISQWPPLGQSLAENRLRAFGSFVASCLVRCQVLPELAVRSH